MNTQCLYGILLFIVLAILCAGYAHHVDAQRAEDDPQKRNYPLLAIVLAPITLPIFIILSIVIFIMKALFFGVILVLLAMVLIFLRETIILPWLSKMALSIGNKLLDANTFLVRLFWSPRAAQPEIKKSPSPHNLESLSRRFI